VNGIAPGPIKDTVGMSKLGLGPPPEEMEKIFSEIIPLRRMGTKDDIAYAALFLSSSAATYVSGATLVVDGGAVCILLSIQSHFFYSRMNFNDLFSCI
jgi:peroxisomal 2,4-dienoyl-CoA reductase